MISSSLTAWSARGFALVSDPVFLPFDFHGGRQDGVHSPRFMRYAFLPRFTSRTQYQTGHIQQRGFPLLINFELDDTGNHDISPPTSS
jgi:hypothetical protein